MQYIKPEVITLSKAELEAAEIDALLSGCSCQCQCQCQTQ